MPRKARVLTTMALGPLAALMLAAAAAQSPDVAVGTPLPVEVQLVEQAACLVDADSFLVSFQLHTTYPNVGGGTLTLVPGSERVTRLVVARDATSLVSGSDVRVFAMPAGPEAFGTDAGHAVAARPGFAVGGRVVAWVPVSIANPPDERALTPGDYVAQATIAVAGAAEPTPGTGTATAPGWHLAVSRPLVIHIPAPRQEQECGSATAPLQLVTQPDA